MKKEYKILLSLSLIATGLFSYLIYQNHTLKKENKELKDNPKVKVVKIKKVIEKPKTVSNCLVCINKEILWKNIKHYKDISNKTRKRILNAIYKYSKKYNINPVIIYSLIATESGFRYWIKHSYVTIKVNKRKIKTQAIGLGAIIWEWWGDKLKKAGIAEVKSDLFDIDTNVEATCFVYNELRNMQPINGLNKEDSAKLRYFGGGIKNKWYVDRINKVTGELLQDAL